MEAGQFKLGGPPTRSQPTLGQSVLDGLTDPQKVALVYHMNRSKDDRFQDLVKAGYRGRGEENYDHCVAKFKIDVEHPGEVEVEASVCGYYADALSTEGDRRSVGSSYEFINSAPAVPIARHKQMMRLGLSVHYIHNVHKPNLGENLAARLQPHISESHEFGTYNPDVEYEMEVGEPINLVNYEYVVGEPALRNVQENEEREVARTAAEREVVPSLAIPATGDYWQASAMNGSWIKLGKFDTPEGILAVFKEDRRTDTYYVEHPVQRVPYTRDELVSEFTEYILDGELIRQTPVEVERQS